MLWLRFFPCRCRAHCVQQYICFQVSGIGNVHLVFAGGPTYFTEWSIPVYSNWVLMDRLAYDALFDGEPTLYQAILERSSRSSQWDCLSEENGSGHKLLETPHNRISCSQRSKSIADLWINVCWSTSSEIQCWTQVCMYMLQQRFQTRELAVMMFLPGKSQGVVVRHLRPEFLCAVVDRARQHNWLYETSTCL